jgi:hypothetical protein
MPSRETTPISHSALAAEIARRLFLMDDVVGYRLDEEDRPFHALFGRGRVEREK